MKNKKLFGKLNVVDVVIILAVLAVAVFVVVRYLLPGGTVGQTAYVDMEYTVVVEAMPKEAYEALSAQLPQQMVGSGAYLDGTIERAEAEPCTVNEIEVKDPSNTTYTYLVEPAGEYVRVTFYLRARVAENTLVNEVGTQEVRVGRLHYIKTRDCEVVGTITSVSRP